MHPGPDKKEDVKEEIKMEEMEDEGEKGMKKDRLRDLGRPAAAVVPSFFGH